MIETGYMRRIPVLGKDKEYDFYHMGTRRSFKVLAPLREELFSNKWCTMLYRGSSRDLFDVHKITKTSFDVGLFSGAAVVDSLMRGLPRLIDIDIESVIRRIRFDTYLMNIIPDEKNIDEDIIYDKVVAFSENIIDGFQGKLLKLMERFYDDKVIDTELLNDLGLFHDSISQHPALLWQLEQLKEK
jgi:hypothetical protein